MKNIEKTKLIFVNLCDILIEIGFYISILTLLYIKIIPLTYQAIGASISLFFWLIKSILQSKASYIHYPWNLTLTILNIWCWLSLIWSVNTQNTVNYSAIFSAGSLLSIMLSSNITKKFQITRITIFLSVIGTIISIKSIAPALPTYISALKSGQFSGETFLFRKTVLPRIGYTFGEANTLGGFYALLIPYLFSIIFFGSDIVKSDKTLNKIFKFFCKLFGYPIIILFLITLMMTSSRGAILGLIASLLFIFFVRRNKQTNLILLLIILILLTLPQIRNFLGYIYAGIVDESRIIIWLNSLELIKIFPFTGVGLGNFKIAYSLYFGEEMMHAHNIYLNTAAELGLPGFIMLVILSVQIIAFGIIFTKQKEDKFYYALNLGLTSMAFGFIIRCLTDFTL